MTVHKNSEILAPAGSFEALEAAVQSGADTVYFGGRALNARRTATNFDDDEIAAAVEYCRSYGVKAYITLNTLMADSELDQMLRLTQIACEAGAHALIVQDLGVAKTIRSLAKDMPLHASTQMSVHTKAGLRLLADLGFKRVVLPRELSFKEIEELVGHSEIETEVFVHGALCMSFSGKCYMSSLLGSRSGNRGLCAGPCRLPFAANGGGTGYDLSLKDLSLISRLKELQALGVRSFKIEGRMKRPEYVAAAVTACKKALKGELTENIEADLRAVFSRSGFTQGYYEGNRGPHMFGIRQKEDVTAAGKVLPSLKALYQKKRQPFAVDFSFQARLGQAVKLSAHSQGKSFSLKSDFKAEAARTRELDRDTIASQLQKSGGTPFYVRKIDIEIEQGLNIALSAINALRREALEGLAKALSEPEKKKSFENKKIDFKKYEAKGEPGLIARFDNPAQIPDKLHGIKELIVPSKSALEVQKMLEGSGVKVIAEAPCLLFDGGRSYEKELQELKTGGIKAAWVGTLDALALAKEKGMEIFASPGNNIFNSLALEAYEGLGAKRATLSFELSLAQAADLGGQIERGLMAYGRLPLMLTRNCPIANERDCKTCPGQGRLVDRKNIEFPVKCSHGYSTVYNSRPLYLADKMKEIKNIDHLILYFSFENKGECQRIIRAYQEGSKALGEFTRGLSFRGVD